MWNVKLIEQKFVNDMGLDGRYKELATDAVRYEELATGSTCLLSQDLRGRDKKILSLRSACAI